jgi:transposase-like protein
MGRLSNPVQRRLSEATVDALVSAYLEGSSIDSLAAQNGVNRTTIIHHLDRRGIGRRRSVRKMTDRSVRQAAKNYEAGESLKVVAQRFGVDPRTLASEFRRAGVAIRPRRGWRLFSGESGQRSNVPAPDHAAEARPSRTTFRPSGSNT